MKPDADERSPAPPEQPGPALRPRSSRIYYAIFIPLGIIGFAVSFYVTYQRNEPLQMPARLHLPPMPFPSSSAPPYFEEGPPDPPPAPSR